jgi:DNA replication protein DnaC
MEELIKKMMKLKLKTMSEQLELIFNEGKKNNDGLIQILHQLIDIELEARWQKSTEYRFKQSKLDEKLTIDMFDFNHHPSRKKMRTAILDLLELKFIDEKMNLIFFGHSGTGKTFLAKVIAYKACLANYRVLFTTAMDMINQLIAAKADNSIARKLLFYTKPDLLCCDELGYLTLDEQCSNLFFQVISSRYKKNSTLITANRVFTDWGKVLYNTTIATAIADRIVENSEIFIIEGRSYRLKRKKDSFQIDIKEQKKEKKDKEDKENEDKI